MKGKRQTPGDPKCWPLKSKLSITPRPLRLVLLAGREQKEAMDWHVQPLGVTVAPQKIRATRISKMKSIRGILNSFSLRCKPSELNL